MGNELPPAGAPAPGPCYHCGDPNAKVTRQNTAYCEDANNWACLCPVCQAEADEHWKEMWAELYAGYL